MRRVAFGCGVCRSRLFAAPLALQRSAINILASDPARAQRLATLYDQAAASGIAAQMARRTSKPLVDLCVPYLRLQKGMKVADIGCGEGTGLRALREGVGGEGQVVGVDLSSQMIDLARRGAGGNGFRFVLGYYPDCMSQESLRQGGYDAVLSIQTLHYCGDINAAVRGVGAMLKPSGTAAIVVDTHESPSSLLSSHGAFLKNATVLPQADWRRTIIDAGLAVEREAGLLTHPVLQMVSTLFVVRKPSAAGVASI
eukprot:Hpha_TRINITY_DN19309_c0_g1::TRINITY_DN19309_c0_g1_i1::g.81207::m.81207